MGSTAVPVKGPDLSILLDHAVSFLGGQVVSGYVTRKLHYVGSSTSVKVRLCGRVQSHVMGFNEVSVDDIEKEKLGGIYHLFGREGIDLQLHQGPLHITRDSNDERKWPFALTIPEHPQPPPKEWYQGKSAAFLRPEDRTASILPPTFSYGSSGDYGWGSEASVGYFLEAVLSGDKAKECKAVRPITIRSQSSPIPITDFDIHRCSEKRITISSERLLPDMQNSKLSLSQKVKQLVGLSKVPRYSFLLQTHIPGVLQLGIGALINLQLRAIPLLEESTEAIRETPPQIVIKQFSLIFDSKTSFLGPGSVSQTSEGRTRSAKLASYQLAKQDSHRGQAHRNRSTSLSSTQAPISQPTQAGEPTDPVLLTVPTGEASTPLDLGEALGLDFDLHPDRYRLTPTFTSCNVKHWHELRWELVLIVAGVNTKMNATHAVDVMGPPDRSHWRAAFQED